MKITKFIPTLHARTGVFRQTKKCSLATGRDIETMLLYGNRSIKTVISQSIDEMAMDFTLGAKSLAREYGTKNFILGGGIFDSEIISSAFFASVRKQDHQMNLAKALLGNESGALGAAAKALSEERSNLTTDEVVLGIDIGATEIKFIASGYGDPIVTRRKTPSSKELLVQTISEEIIDIYFKNLWASYMKIRAIGIGVPGIIKEGKIACASFLNVTSDDWKFDLGAEIGSKLKKRGLSRGLVNNKIMPVSIVVLNDAEAAVWGEKVFRAGTNLKDFIFLTFGSGLGGGFSAEGADISNIEPGQRTFINAEYGGIDTIYTNKQKTETFEYYVSTTALLRRINKKLSLF